MPKEIEHLDKQVPGSRPNAIVQAFCLDKSNVKEYLSVSSQIAVFDVNFSTPMVDFRKYK